MAFFSNMSVLIDEVKHLIDKHGVFSTQVEKYMGCLTVVKREIVTEQLMSYVRQK